MSRLEAVIASAAKQSTLALRHSGLLRRFRLRSLSYGRQVAPRNDDKYGITTLAAGKTWMAGTSPAMTVIL
jgi:hypothetical protein